MSDDYRNDYRRTQIQNIRAAQEDGMFIFGYSEDMPFPSMRDFKAVDKSWTESCYRYESKLGAYVLNRDHPLPDQFADWPKAQAVEAVVRPCSVEIVGTDVVLDMDTTSESRYSELAVKINSQLSRARTGLHVWAFTREADDQNPICSIANESARVHASSLVWCHQDQALVAAVMVDTSTQTLQAIRASLAVNRSRSPLLIKAPGGSVYVNNVKRGYPAVTGNLAKANAIGTVQVILHPLCGNPQEETEDHFYVVATPGEDLAQKAGDRLALAIPWPTNPEWTEYLLTEGKSASLVEDLPVIGPDFTSGLRAEKSQEGWQIIIAEGLRSGKIKI